MELGAVVVSAVRAFSESSLLRKWLVEKHTMPPKQRTTTKQDCRQDEDTKSKTQTSTTEAKPFPYTKSSMCPHGRPIRFFWGSHGNPKPICKTHGAETLQQQVLKRARN